MPSQQTEHSRTCHPTHNNHHIETLYSQDFAQVEHESRGIGVNQRHHKHDMGKVFAKMKAAANEIDTQGMCH